MSAPSRGAVPPPPTREATPLPLWLALPPANRRRPLWLLSQLLERQRTVADRGRSEEGCDDSTARR